jgi:DNA-binding NarL/FixJ family response regulator
MSSILLIQSDPAASARLCSWLDSDQSVAVCGIAHTLEQAHAAIARRVPDLLIGDLRLPDGALVNLLEQLRPGRSHVVALAASLRDPQLMHALHHSADAYLLYGQAPETLRSLVSEVLAGQSPMAPEIARQVLAHFDALNTRPIAAGSHGRLRLTEAEHCMLEWTGEGYLVQEVARGLRVTPEQVGRLMRAVYRRLHADLRARQAAVRDRVPNDGVHPAAHD